MAGLKPDKGQSLTHALLARAHSPDSTQRIFTDKIQHRPLLLRPSSPPPAATAGTGSDARAARRTARRRQQQQKRDKRRGAGLRPEPLSARQRRQMGLYDLRQSSDATNNRKKIKYSVFEPLHSLWLGYIREILGTELFTGGQAAAAKLAAADLHGARVRVARSSCPSRVGIEGIVVRDSRFALQVVTRSDAVKLVPKEGTTFRIDVSTTAAPPVARTAETGIQPSGQQDSQQKIINQKPTEGNGVPDQKDIFTFEVLGDQFQTRAADRANRKFRAHFLKNL